MNEQTAAWARARVMENSARLAAQPRGGYGSIHFAGGSPAAQMWADLHPDAERVYCCLNEIEDGPAACTCWRPEYDQTQADPVPPTSPDELQVQTRKCHDCAYRPGSPERSDEDSAEALRDHAYGARPFFCHTGVRKPVRWRHPDGRTVDGDPADYRPPVVDGIPYQADGRPSLICAGWAAMAAGIHNRERTLP